MEMSKDSLTMESRSETKIIGGLFGLENMLSLNDCCPPFLADSNVFLVNARSGILLLTQLLAPRNVWLPSYLCASIIEAVEKSKAAIRFYEVSYNLDVLSRAWLK